MGEGLLMNDSIPDFHPVTRAKLFDSSDSIKSNLSKADGEGAFQLDRPALIEGHLTQSVKSS
jgi:hypothetical protein